MSAKIIKFKPAGGAMEEYYADCRATGEPASAKKAKLGDPGVEMDKNGDLFFVGSRSDVSVISCAGLPLCNLQGDKAVEAQLAGCELCKRIEISPDHSQLVTDRTIN
jgi:hypothetical protein